MGVLNFCDPCGALRVREVKGQLEKLITVKTKPRAHHCGLCQTELDRKGISIKKEPIKARRKKCKQEKSTGDIQVKVEKTRTRLKTGTIKPVHFEDLDSGADDDSIDIPFECVNVSEDSDASTDDKKPIVVKAIKVEGSAFNKKQKGKGKKKKKARQEKVLTDAEFAKRRALDERVLAMVDKDAPKTRSLTCKECKMVFCHIQKFVKHIGTHMEGELNIDLPYVCPICAQRAGNFLSLDRHLILHKQEKPYCCKWPDCKASFACKRYLTKHIRRHEGHKSYYRRPAPKIRKFKCSKCEYMAISRESLSFHENTHTQARPFKCDFCDRSFNNPRNKTIHERNMHSTSKDNHFMCESCGYSSFFKADLLKHQRIHTGDKPFACEICDYRSSRRDNLRKHIRIHTGEKKHKCHYCDIVFHSQQSCKDHEKDIHINAQPIAIHKTKEGSVGFHSQQVFKELEKDILVSAQPEDTHHAKDSSLVFHSQQSYKEHEKDIDMNAQSVASHQAKDSSLVFHSQQSYKEQDKDIHVNAQPVATHQAKDSSSVFHSQQSYKEHERDINISAAFHRAKKVLPLKHHHHLHHRLIPRSICHRLCQILITHRT
ncbi:uncharacterized protein [Amphiura filiformis]|uniref:uncharacterized protein n=1 Tax=Amphiura filiformis TaxID=82378 RepID=UPI003B212680